MIRATRDEWKQKVKAAAFWHELLTPPDTEACIVWTHRCHPGKRPYGEVRFEGKLWLVHRLAYVLHKGAIPQGLDVCHHCDNPPCWNPRHLFTGTRADNMQDSKRKGRNFIPRGELHPKAILTEQLVREIRSRYRPHTRGLGSRSLSYLYPVSESTIRQIIERKIWRHI
jgi:hypothetical protein